MMETGLQFCNNRPKNFKPKGKRVKKRFKKRRR